MRIVLLLLVKTLKLVHVLNPCNSRNWLNLRATPWRAVINFSVWAQCLDAESALVVLRVGVVIITGRIILVIALATS